MTGGERPLNSAADTMVYMMTGAITVTVFAGAIAEIVASEAFADWITWLGYFGPFYEPSYPLIKL